MSTKALFMTAMGDPLLPFGKAQKFVRSSGDILTASAHGLETGAGPYKVRNNVADPPSGLVEAVHASTFMTASTIIATDVLEVNGKDYTIINTPANDGDVDTGASDALTLTNLVAAINSDLGLGPLAAAGRYDLDTVPNPEVFAIVTTATRIDIFARTLDAALGNAITCSSVDGTMTVDNATLENGAEGTDYFIIRLSDDTFSLATTKALADAGTAQALADAGTGINHLVPIVESLANALEDVIVNVLTATGARTMDATFNIAKFWRAAIDGVHTDRV